MDYESAQITYVCFPSFNTYVNILKLDSNLHNNKCVK